MIPRFLSRDFRLLQLFTRIVEHGGFTQAQAALNLGQSTISTQMAALEQQLGVRLCHRGRSGFRLTEEGERVYQAAQRLFAATADFQGEVASLRGGLAGDLSLHVVDNIATNPACRLSRAIERFTRRSSRARLTVTVDVPDNIELAVLDGRCHVGVGSFFHHSAGLRYEPLFTERQVLVCGRKHPLFGKAEEALTVESVSRHAFIAHGYAQQQILDVPPAGSAFHMEAVALLVLSGRYTGYLPDHQAAHWVDRGEMRVLLSAALGYTARFEIVTRGTGLRSNLVEAFVAHLHEAHLLPRVVSAIA
ncbi:LysR family transcriptional regulator [Vineibacter terrae]|uniref:LysR family transcriptional regulator n=1 Tax=Vineibacter terrae TaxID=2586908 RepID=UPI002E2F70AA|nr:LysR family transcriptional regulator [Vineibacter terrae]HEX2887733.1 LysR family transcriptional regulator [Vineibacter terrae]